MTAINRRQFVMAGGLVTAGVAVPWWLKGASKEHAKDTQWLVSACSDNKNNHFIAAVDEAGSLIHRFPLPARAHDVLAMPHKPGHALVFARRPGSFAMEVDFGVGRVVQEFSSGAASRFYGHGALSADNQYLFTTENNFSAGRGQIAVRNTENYQVEARYDSGGVGPHECMLMPDKRILVIANGGILTHPDQPRKKLNLEHMQPNLSYMDSQTGEVLDSVTLDIAQSSIRHLDVSRSGKVFVGLQYQGAKTDPVPLAFCHQRGESPRYLQAEMSVWQQLKQYTASVCVDEALGTVAISCPRADKITFWDLQQETYLGQLAFRDSAGLAIVNRQLTASNGKGQLWEGIERTDTQAQYYQGLRWDNHMTAIQGV